MYSFLAGCFSTFATIVSTSGEPPGTDRMAMIPFSTPPEKHGSLSLLPRSRCIRRGGAIRRPVPVPLGGAGTSEKGRLCLLRSENDLDSGKSPARVSDDFRAFVARVRADLPQVRIAFISMKPSPARRLLLEQMRIGNARIREFIRREPGLSYIDVFTPMLTATGHIREELFTEDRLHLNAAGYALWRTVVAPYLRSEPLMPVAAGMSRESPLESGGTGH